MGLLERGFAYNVLLFCSSNQAQTMCTMFSRKDVFRLFGGLLRISTRKTNAEPRCLTSLDGHALLTSEFFPLKKRPEVSIISLLKLGRNAYFKKKNNSLL